MRVAACVLALMAVLGASSAFAEEGNLKARFGFLAVGTVTPLEEGHVFWSGHFSGSLSQAGGEGIVNNAFVQCPGTNDLNLAGGTAKLQGYCVVSDGAGSQFIATWECTGRPGTCDTGTATWASGTGKWKGITAQVTFTAQLGPALADGSVPGYAEWVADYSLPQ